MKKSLRYIMLTLVGAFAFVVLGMTFTVEAKEKNLLVNGNAEDGMTGWVDTCDRNEYPDGLWNVDDENFDGYAVLPKEGNWFFWPKNYHCEEATMYQDVDISKMKKGTILKLTGWLNNYDQTPHDQAILKLEIRDAKGKKLVSESSQQRNPEWKKHEISLAIPAKAVTARVYCIAKRFVGFDNDAYFDNITLTASTKKYAKVYVVGNKSKAKPGDKITLKASDGKYTKATDYVWTSSYDEIATVSKKGVVTMNPDCQEDLIGEEVWIYARNKKTGMVGKYYINSKNKNDKKLPKKSSK